MKKIIIAVDGHSACGKSTTARELARRLNYVYIDSGAMYRAVTLFFIRNDVNAADENEVSEALEKINIEFRLNEHTGLSDTYLNGENVEQEIRKMYVTQQVSEVSTVRIVREKVVAQQREMGKLKGLVMDGRDIGSVVFPDAELKLFITADLKVRAVRRKKELEEKGQVVDIEEIISNLEKRDYIDSHREESPLVQVPEAVVIDTSNLTFEEQVSKAVELANERIDG